MDVTLPSSILYQSPPALPDVVAKEYVIQASNAATFGPSSVAEFVIPSQGFIIPESVMLRYKLTVPLRATNVGANQVYTSLIGIPFATLINRSELYAGSTPLEIIPNYNIVLSKMLDLQMNVADKYGMQSCLGFSSSQITMPNQDSYTWTLSGAGSQNLFLAGPLMNLISTSEKLFPAALSGGNLMLRLTFETLANAFVATNTTLQTVDPSGDYTISNLELVYQAVEWDSSVVDMIKSQAGADGKFFVKASSFGVASQYLNSGINGRTELSFNQRYASIKSLFTLFNGQTNNRNKVFDSFDITSSNGEYQYNIAGTVYPQRPISTYRHGTAGALMELKQALGSVFSKNNSLSLNRVEYDANDTSLTTQYEIGKFTLGCSTEKLSGSSSSVLLNGVSSQQAPINLSITLNTTTTQPYNVYNIVWYDALIEVDVNNRVINVRY